MRAQAPAQSDAMLPSSRARRDWAGGWMDGLDESCRMLDPSGQGEARYGRGQASMKSVRSKQASKQADGQAARCLRAAATSQGNRCAQLVMMALSPPVMGSSSPTSHTYLASVLNYKVQDYHF